MPVGGSTAIALDKSGKPHISYYNWSAHALMYAFKDAEAWQKRLINGNEYIDGSISLVLDFSDKVHITYFSWNTNSLKYVVSQQPECSSAEILKNPSPHKQYGCFVSMCTFCL